MKTITQGLGHLAEAFLLSKRVNGCTDHNLEIYRLWLGRFFEEGCEPNSIAAHTFLAGWQGNGLKFSTLQRGMRALRVFFGWCVAAGEVASNPFSGIHIRLPKTLPTVPKEDELRTVIATCAKGVTGLRNRAIVLTLADSGLRATELIRLLIEDWNPTQRSLFVRSGKGAKDRVTFVSPTTARTLREYLLSRRVLSGEDFLFVTDDGNLSLKRRHLLQILHRLSKRAGLPPARRLYPHALRHYAATSWLRHGMGLDEVRRLLGHATLSTTLLYSSLVASDLQQAHKKAAAIERMGLSF